MENKIATLLGNAFSTAENQVSQSDDQTFGSIAETLVIHFDQERFEQLLSRGSTSPLHLCKNREVSVAKAPMANSWKQVSVETNKALCKPITVLGEAKQTLCESSTVSAETTVLGEAKQTLCESSTVSAETNIASRQHVNTAREAIKVPREPKIASAKAMWIAKSVVPCEVRYRSLDSASCEAKIVSDCKTISALHRAKPRLSREARVKALCANSEVTAAPLTSSALLGSARLAASGKTKALSAQIASLYEANATLCRVQPRLSRETKAKALLYAKSVVNSASLPLIDLSREVKNEAPLSANSEADTGRTLHNRAKLAFKGKAKAVASSCEATLSGEAILASPMAKKTL